MESIDVFSRLLGARLYGDLRMFEEAPESWQKDAENVKAKIREEKKRSRIKIKTRANLIQEFPGLFESCDERNGILRMVYPEGEGDFAYGHIHCLEIPKEKKKRIKGLPKVNPVYEDKAIDEGHYEYGEESGHRNSGGGGIALSKVDLETLGKTFAERNVVASYEYEETDYNEAFWECYGGSMLVVTENGDGGIIVTSQAKTA